ncbi:MAG: hypothetical protein K0U52_06390, partial [Gammaproteobacteria bacterium]|nr:hypothetical protein [Gammaproteobacteria bacterium]
QCNTPMNNPAKGMMIPNMRSSVFIFAFNSENKLSKSYKIRVLLCLVKALVGCVVVTEIAGIHVNKIMMRHVFTALRYCKGVSY